MFGLKKNKSNAIQDETLVDHSKKILVGTIVLILVIITVLILEIVTFSIKGSQSKQIVAGQQAEKKSQNILIEMGKIGKQSKEKEYEFIKSLRTIMSPMQFQKFKNSISTSASMNNVFLASLNEGAPVKVSDYIENTINFESVSSYDEYVSFNKTISETPFRINFEKETITRETPTSLSIKVQGVIKVIVYENKDKLFMEKAKFIKQMQLAEEKKMAREKRLKELREKKSK